MTTNASLESATARAYDRLADRHPEEFRQLLADELADPTPPQRIPRATRLGYSRPMRDEELGEHRRRVPVNLDDNKLREIIVHGDGIHIRQQIGESPVPPEPLPDPPARKPAEPKEPAAPTLYVGMDRDGKRHAGREQDVTGYALCGAVITTGHALASRLGCYRCRELAETR